MRSSVLLRRALAGAFAAGFALVSACTALLDGAPQLGDHCEFEGDSSDCGQCLRDQCQDEVDACCGGACGRALDHLDACASGNDVEACARLKSVGGGEEDDDRATDLGRCVERECDSSCSSAVSITRCSGDDDSCSCRVDRGDANTATCALDLGGCCADISWPAAGSCECAVLSCNDGFESCSCERGGDGSTESACDDRGYAFCCITALGCECRDGPSCDALGQAFSATCWVGEAACHQEDQGQLEVDACHATESDLED